MILTTDKNELKLILLKSLDTTEKNNMEEYNLWSLRKFSNATLSLQLLIASGIISTPIVCSRRRQK